MRYKLLLTTVTILLMLTESFAQTYNMPASGSAEITSCTGTVYDPGGTGNYLDNTNSVLTIRPSDTTAFVFLSFSSFDLESGYDNLYIYDGTTTSAPLIATYTGYSAAAVYASNADGALTLRFSTDYSVTYSGFIATLSCIDSIPMADLFFESAFVNASSVNAGSSLSISSTVGNSSIISSYSTSMAYYLSDDMVLDGSDIQLSSSTLPAITGGNSTTITTSVTIPAATSQGAYYILFFADNIQGVTESNEANNIAAAQIMIVGAIADLSPRSFVLSPELTVRGSTISITASILNYGNVQSSTSFAGIYYSSDSLLDSGDSLLSEAAVSAISAGGYATLVTSAPLPDTLSAGEHYLLLRADNHDTIQESDETNNVLAARFAINEGLPDLTISSATPSVNSIAPGESLTISYVISNIGISNAFSSNSAVYLSSDTLWDLMDIFLGSESGTAISPTFTLTKNVMATIPGGLGSGTYYLLVYADYFNEVIEAREDNNIYHTPIVIPDAFTDLRLDAPAATVHYILAGGSATASCTVYNNGNTLCPSGSVGFYLSIDAGFDGTDVFLNSGNFATLAVGTSAVASASITIPPGTLNAEYYLLYFADYADAIAEDDETNNVSVIPITVSNAGSDLAATTPTLGNSAASPGGSVNATCYVRNYGNQNASYSYTGFYLSNDSIYQPTDTLLSSVYTGTLAAGASSYRSTTINIPSNTTYGDYYVLYFADRSELVNELNEDNNVCALPISIMAPSPDLIITTPTLSSNSVAPGQGLSAYCYIKNQGSATAASSYIGYYLSTDTIYSVSDTYLGYYAGSSLIAGSSSYRTKSLTVPGGTVPGTYYLLFFADYSTSVSEENETNNVSWCQLDVPVAFEDLTIQNASI
ncbi:MAG: hypothetical protein KKA07_11395, partial [Bacteroidetes bacterium]|nr:hypothetical protein [Bacteroidota bacterium]